MYILGINGSPRRGGNTDILLDKVLETAGVAGARAEKVILNELKFSPCQECENMPDDGTCVVNDDMQAFYKKVDEADAVILASPIFFGSLSAQTKTMIDRFQCRWRAKYLFPPKAGIATSQKRRTGAFISVEASMREDFFANARAIVKNFFATINVDYKEELLCPGIDKKASILNHPDFLKQVAELGVRIASGQASLNIPHKSKKSFLQRT